MSDTDTTAVPDTIERELVLPHPVERVWRALTDPTELAAWFGDTADLDARPGGRGRLAWGDHRCTIDVEVADPPRRFAFWWPAAGETPAPGNRTLVDFTLTAVEGGTQLRLVESGFAALPDAAAKRQDNVGGWDAELADLTAHLGAG